MLDILLGIIQTLVEMFEPLYTSCADDIPELPKKPSKDIFIPKTESEKFAKGCGNALKKVDDGKGIPLAPFISYAEDEETGVRGYKLGHDWVALYRACENGPVKPDVKK